MAVSAAADGFVDASGAGADPPTAEYEKPKVGGPRQMAGSATADGAVDAAPPAADPPMAE